MVIRRYPSNSRKLNVKDKMWIFSDENLLTMKQKTNGEGLMDLAKIVSKVFMVMRG